MNINETTIKEIQHQYKILAELHGSVNKNELVEIVAKDFGIDLIDAHIAINATFEKLPTDDKYGLVIGRFQPFHFGHQHIINEILLDGRIPVILIGDDDGKDLNKNPLTVEQRATLIEQVFPGECIIISVKDNVDWGSWFDEVVGKLKQFAKIENVSLYFHNKECDRYDYFSHKGKDYYNEFYTKIYEDAGFNLRPVQFVERSDIVIDADARNIRDDFEAFKHLMDGRNYWTLKSWGW